MSGPPPARAGTVAALAVVAALGALRVAWAQPGSFGLTWEAPAECPDEASVRAAVTQLVSGAGASRPVRVEARARVDRAAADLWRVRLTTTRDGATGERVIESSSCRSLADAAALIVALTIDPEGVAARQAAAATSPAASTPSPVASAAPGASPGASPLPAGPSPVGSGGGPSPAPPASAAAAASSAAARPAPPASAAPRDPPPPAPAPPAPATTSPAASVASPLPLSRVSIVLSAGGDLGTLPSPAYGFAGGASLLFPGARFELYGAYWPAQAGHVASSPSLGGTISLATAGARGCLVPLSQAFEVGICPGLELGTLHGQGSGLTSPLPVDGLWLALTLGGRLSWRVTSHLGLALDLGLAVPLRRDQFEIDNVGTVSQAGPVVGRALAGPELRF